jgi:calnexin
MLVHFIFRLKNPKTGKYVEHHLKNPPKPFNDKFSHVYTAIIYPDNMLKLLLDGDENQTADLLSPVTLSLQLSPPETILDLEDENFKTGIIMPRFQILKLPSLTTGMRKHPEN